MESINPTPSYTFDPAETVFLRALDHISPACIYNLLHISQTSHLQYLQQMLLQPHQVSISISTKTAFPSDAPFLNESLRCLVLPSFSVDSLSIRYQVFEHVRSSVSSYTSPYITRCLLDDEHGISLMFSEFDNGLTEVVVIIKPSQAFHERISMVLATAPFRLLIETLSKGGVYKEGMMQDALKYTFRTREIHPCPSCGKRSFACTCTPRLVRKRNASDFENDLFTVMGYMGSYDGVGYQTIYEGGVNLSTWVSSIVTTTNFSFNTEESHKLGVWAMWRTLEGRENLYKMVMPNATHGATVPQRLFLPSHAAAPTSALHMASGDGITFPQEHSFRTHAMAFPSDSHEAPEHDQTAVFRECNVTIRGHLPGVEVGMGAQSAARIESNLVDKDPVTCPSKHRRMGRPPTPKRSKLTRVASILPANMRVSADAGSSINNPSFHSRSKLELRKARNRESAVRSNEKKKERIKALEDNLEEAKEKSVELRQKEQELKEENLALRAKLEER